MQIHRFTDSLSLAFGRGLAGPFSIYLFLFCLFEAITSRSAVLREDFSSNPAAPAGWRVEGEASLFRWEPTRAALDVTWDSRRTNSYFYKPLGVILSRTDDFRLSFQLELSSLQIGIDPSKKGTFQIGVGLLGLAQAKRPDFFRGTGVQPTHGPRNIMEFNYFPDSGFGATVSPTLVSADNQLVLSFNFPLEMDLGAKFFIELRYTATNGVLASRMTRNGIEWGPLKAVKLDSSFTDFRLDAVAVCSYSDAGQDPPEWAGSILARGWVDEIEVETPESPVSRLEVARRDASWVITFAGRPDFTYGVERSKDLAGWLELGRPELAAGGRFEFTDATPAASAYYRIAIAKP